jgi:membrane-bound ClpP family serine protease
MPLAHLTPDAALTLFTAGIALIAVELNRPGLILPGAAGLTASLLAVAALAHQPIRTGGCVLVLTGLALLLLGFLRTLPWIAAAAATLALPCGFLLLLRPGTVPELHPAVSIACGLVLGLGLAGLAHIARRARRAKGLD